MVCRHRMSSVMVLAKTCGLFALTSIALFAQETGSITFNPRYTDELTLDWKTALASLGLALACGCFWKLLIWALESTRTAVNWKIVRFWWPTAMLVWGWTLALFGYSKSSGTVYDAVLVVFGLLNLPALVAAAVVIGLLDHTDYPAVWVKLVAGSLTMWIANYRFVGLAEWRAWLNVPVSLHLTDPSSDRSLARAGPATSAEAGLN